MDDLEVIKATLNNTIARHSKIIQAYEVEIANLTAQVVFLQSKFEEANDSQVSFEEVEDSKNKQK